MRTPGSDFELALGHCVSEGILGPSEPIDSVAYCLGPDGEQEYNVVTIAMRRPVAASVVPRAETANASCGLCGKQTLDDLARHCPPVDGALVLDAATVAALPERLRADQRVFADTGGIHAAAWFDASGTIVATREDVGRHNAVDKLVGWAFLAQRLPCADLGLLVSGRVSFEIVQKAAAAGVPLVVAVSAPSSLALRAAEQLGITVVAFVRDGRANVYTHPERIVTAG